MADRSRLVAAHDGVAKAQDTVTNLEAALERSASSVAGAKVGLHKVVSGGSAEELGRLEELKAGGKLTPLASIRRVTRFQAEEEVELAEKAHAALERETDSAKRRLAIAGTMLYWEAVRVTYDESAPLIAELQTINHRRHELRSTLAGLVNHKLEKNKPVDLAEPAGLSKALTDVAPSIRTPLGTMTARWSKVLETLMNDPGAEVQEPPPAREDDVAA